MGENRLDSNRLSAGIWSVDNNKDDSQEQNKKTGDEFIEGKLTESVSGSDVDKSEVTSTSKAAEVPSKSSPEQEKPTSQKVPTVSKPPSQSKKSASDKKLSDKTSSGQALPKKGSLVKWLLVLCLLLLIAVTGAAGWWFYQFQQQQPVAQQNLTNQQAEIQRLEQRLNEDRREGQQRQAELSQAISGFQLKINSHARRLRELSTTSRTDWLLAEAEYLIRLANQRLITERNTKNASTLLVTADGILRDLDEVDLLVVREALAKSITTLRSVPMVDREGLYLQLGALSGELVKLPLITRNREEPELSDIDVEETVSSGWKDQLLQGFQVALDSAGKLIRIQRRDVPIAPLPSAEENQQLRHNLAVMLEQAQMALLREEQVIYQASLGKAQQWLGDYFELNESALSLVEQLSFLEQQNVVQQLPDISEGLEVLRDYIDSWHKRYVVQAPTKDASEGDQQ
jgi:uroporphyrin-III C-methyltransferase